MNVTRLFLSVLAVLFCMVGSASSQNQSSAGVQATVNENGTGAVTLTAKGVLPKPPLFFTAQATAKVKVANTEITQEIPLTLKVLQGRPDLMTLGLNGSGEVISVSGKDLSDWAVRTSADGGCVGAEACGRAVGDHHSRRAHHVRRCA